MADDSPLSDLSSLSSAESVETDGDVRKASALGGKLDQWIKSGTRTSTTTPPKRKRVASPPHEYVLADNPDIAFLVMFRARFSAAFPRSCPNFGPQDIERGIVGEIPDDGVEKLLCALIGLVLNRKKDVEKGHYTRALEEAISTNSHQWPRAWAGKNPLHGGGSFHNMKPSERLTFLKALVMWTLNSSDAIQTILKESYKQSRQEDDLNQPLSVQPWGRDGEKRRYWLIEGQDDTHFRLYRESNPVLKTNTWWSIADSIDTIQSVGDKLEEDGTQASRRLKERILAAVPRFEAGEDKRKRREYRLNRKAMFQRADPGFSLYEGRTRGKKIRYTYSDNEEDSDISTRRSTRHSGISTPAEPAGPTFTASGRQVRSRIGGTYGEIMHSGQHDVEQEQRQANGEDEEGEGRPARATRSGQTNGRGRGHNAVDDMHDESDASSSGNEWQEAEDDEDEHIADDAEDELSDAEISEDEDDTGHKSLVISLKVPKDAKSSPTGIELEAPKSAVQDLDKPDVVMTNGQDTRDEVTLVNSELDKETNMEVSSLTDAEPKSQAVNESIATNTTNGTSFSSETAAPVKAEVIAPVALQNEDKPINGITSPYPKQSAPMLSSLPK